MRPALGRFQVARIFTDCYRASHARNSKSEPDRMTSRRSIAERVIARAIIKVLRALGIKLTPKVDTLAHG